MHHRDVLFGREAFGRVGVDFAWNVHVVKIVSAGQSADHLKDIIVPPRTEGRRAEVYCSATRCELSLYVAASL